MTRSFVRRYESSGAFPYHGLGYVEFKRDTVTGQTLIVEPNIGRPTGRCALVEASGVALLHTMYCDLAGLPLPENREQQYLGVKLVWLRRDLISSVHRWRKGELSLREWWTSLRGRKAYALWSWRDPVPFLLDCGRSARLLATGRERRKRAFATPAAAGRADAPASRSGQAPGAGKAST